VAGCAIWRRFASIDADKQDLFAADVSQLGVEVDMPSHAVADQLCRGIKCLAERERLVKTVAVPRT
jgi:hypothetical protein